MPSPSRSPLLLSVLLIGVAAVLGNPRHALAQSTETGSEPLIRKQVTVRDYQATCILTPEFEIQYTATEKGRPVTFARPADPMPGFTSIEAVRAAIGANQLNTCRESPPDPESVSFIKVEIRAADGKYLVSQELSRQRQLDCPYDGAFGYFMNVNCPFLKH